MNKLVRHIWWIVVPTALAVLASQLYWLRTNYLEQRKGFIQVTSDALEKAYDEAMLKSLDRLQKKKTDQKEKKSEIMTMAGAMTIRESNVNLNKKIDSMNSKIIKELAKDGKTTMEDRIITLTQRWSDKPDSVVNQEINPQMANLDFNHFLAGMLSVAQLTEVDTVLIRKNLDKELKLRHVTLPFKLTLLKKDTLLNDNDASTIFKRIISPKKKMIVLIRFSAVSSLLFLKILLPVVFSFLLILLITGCIWLLWRIIVRQKKLEVMKNDFISNISHELKTPLSILSATNEVLLKFWGINDREKTERYLLLEQAELHKLQSMVEKIMTLTRMEHNEDELIGPKDTVDLTELVEDVLSRFSGLSGINIYTEFFVQDPHLYTNPNGLKIILFNLIDNAIKYTSELDKEVFVKIEEEQNNFMFSMIDFGISIHKAYLPFVFDKFYRVPQGNVHDVKGYGLGLSYVKTAVQKLGGEIKVESSPEKGAIFTFKLKKS